MKKNLFLTFCFSCVPGAGQMYQGYMKRGLSLMILFGISCALIGMISIALFAIPIPIIFAFSFFDTYNIRNRFGTDEEEKDKLIWEYTSIGEALCCFKTSKKSPFIGLALIFIGIYVLINTVIFRFANQYNIEILLIFVSLVSKYLVPILISIFTIGLGIKFISKK